LLMLSDAPNPLTIGTGRAALKERRERAARLFARRQLADRFQGSVGRRYWALGDVDPDHFEDLELGVGKLAGLFFDERATTLASAFPRFPRPGSFGRRSCCDQLGDLLIATLGSQSVDEPQRSGQKIAERSPREQKLDGVAWPDQTR
jgi:hypothetical protein